ncbi:Enolase 4 [Collichthys lucidus]|uniref:Enolase 4 n=1 Tax=Collichthys lucidus TaxID=240159 RepID=A0A4U5VC59_COLLU|nr:Enolase 4 [Collichthys lucidus]
MSYQGFPKRPCTEERDAIKKAAAELFRVNRVPQEVERALNELFFHKPGDVYGYLSMSSAAISSQCGSKEISLDWKVQSQERADHVMTAVQWISDPLNNMLKAQNPCDQSEVDQILR